MSENKTATTEELLASQQLIIAEQAKKLEELSALVKSSIPEIKEDAKPLSIPTELVKFEKKKFKWNVPSFKMPGSTEVVTAEQAATDTELIKAIFGIEGQGLLSEVV